MSHCNVLATTISSAKHSISSYALYNNRLNTLSSRISVTFLANLETNINIMIIIPTHHQTIALVTIHKSTHT